MSHDVLIQGIGVIASLFVIAAYCVKSDTKTKRITMGGSILFALHFAMMGAVVAMGVTLINILRVWLSIRYHGSLRLCAFFVFAYLVIGTLTFEEVIDILAISAPVIGCIAMYCFSGIRFRSVCLIATLCWLVYGVLVGSIGVILTQAVVSSVNIFTIYQLVTNKKKGITDEL